MQRVKGRRRRLRNSEKSIVPWRALEAFLNPSACRPLMVPILFQAPAGGGRFLYDACTIRPWSVSSSELRAHRIGTHRWLVGSFPRARTVQIAY